jgi:RNAse (barnase) inhibitor barstar
MNENSEERCDRLPLQTVRLLRGIETDALRRWAAHRQQRWIEVQLEGAPGKSGVLAAIAREFAFPGWFGMNLDALYDALTDLPANRAESGDGGYAILLTQLTRATDFTAGQRAALLSVFRDAARDFAERSVPFRVFYN